MTSSFSDNKQPGRAVSPVSTSRMRQHFYVMTSLYSTSPVHRPPAPSTQHQPGLHVIQTGTCLLRGNCGWHQVFWWLAWRGSWWKCRNLRLYASHYWPEPGTSWLLCCSYVAVFLFSGHQASQIIYFASLKQWTTRASRVAQGRALGTVGTRGEGKWQYLFVSNHSVQCPQQLSSGANIINKQLSSSYVLR